MQGGAIAAVLKHTWTRVCKRAHMHAIVYVREESFVILIDGVRGIV